MYFNTKKRMLKSEISILEKQDPESFFKLYKMDGYSVDDTYLEIVMKWNKRVILSRSS